MGMLYSTNFYLQYSPAWCRWKLWVFGHVTSSKSPILVVAISFLIVKTPLLCSTDVKLSSVQHHSVSLSAYIHFSDSALSTLISAEHSDQHWTDLSGPLLSPFPANLAGERGKLTLISTDQNWALADQRWSEHVGESKDLEEVCGSSDHFYDTYWWTFHRLYCIVLIACWMSRQAGRARGITLAIFLRLPASRWIEVRSEVCITFPYLLSISVGICEC